MFSAYLELGITHILDLNGYDHMLFIVALCVLYPIMEWRKLLILITAFTLGHSITLFLSVYEIVTVKASIIEFLIPLTILITAIHNLIIIRTEQNKMGMQYLLAAFFGCIHGFGFSNFFKAISPDPSEMLISFFAFNVGVELGQVCIVLGFLLLTYFATRVFRISKKMWELSISILVAVIALYLIFL